MEKEHSHHDVVHIFIDKRKMESPNPTTGIALYDLGSIPEDYDLFREVHGHGDDEFIPKDSITITLKNGDHFYSVQRSLNPGAYDRNR
ncbi:MAG: hypothetical protein ABSE05_13275 [Syntrophales bacterium]